MPRKRSGQFALMDTAFLSDQKWVRLQRRVPEPAVFGLCVGVYWMVLAEARRAKSPDVDWEDWGEYREAVDHLQAVRLLTANGFDPETFEKWAPAYQSPSDRRRSEAASALLTVTAAEIGEEAAVPDNTEVRMGTHGYAELRKGTIPSIQVPSLLVSTPGVTEAGGTEPEVEPEPPAHAREEPEPPKAPWERDAQHDPLDAFVTAYGPASDGARNWLNDLARMHGDAFVAQAVLMAYRQQVPKRGVLGWVRERAVERVAQREAAAVEADGRRSLRIEQATVAKEQALRAADPEAERKAAEKRRSIREELAKVGVLQPENTLLSAPGVHLDPTTAAMGAA